LRRAAAEELAEANHRLGDRPANPIVGVWWMVGQEGLVGRLYRANGTGALLGPKGLGDAIRWSTDGQWLSVRTTIPHDGPDVQTVHPDGSSNSTIGDQWMNQMK
jgi:hypothetical protein